jgi:hypothetical protein
MLRPLALVAFALALVGPAQAHDYGADMICRVTETDGNRSARRDGHLGWVCFPAPQRRLDRRRPMRRADPSNRSHGRRRRPGVSLRTLAAQHGARAKFGRIFLDFCLRKNRICVTSFDSADLSPRYPGHGRRRSEKKWVGPRGGSHSEKNFLFESAVTH